MSKPKDDENAGNNESLMRLRFRNYTPRTDSLKKCTLEGRLSTTGLNRQQTVSNIFLYSGYCSFEYNGQIVKKKRTMVIFFEK